MGALLGVGGKTPILSAQPGRGTSICIFPPWDGGKRERFLLSLPPALRGKVRMGALLGVGGKDPPSLRRSLAGGPPICIFPSWDGGKREKRGRGEREKERQREREKERQREREKRGAGLRPAPALVRLYKEETRGRGLRRL